MKVVLDEPAQPRGSIEPDLFRIAGRGLYQYALPIDMIPNRHRAFMGINTGIAGRIPRRHSSELMTKTARCSRDRLYLKLGRNFVLTRPNLTRTPAQVTPLPLPTGPDIKRRRSATTALPGKKRRPRHDSVHQLDKRLPDVLRGLGARLAEPRPVRRRQRLAFLDCDGAA